MASSGIQNISREQLEAALQRTICRVCIDRNVDGTCSLNARHECALFERFPQIARAILRVQSNHVDDYITAIREDICHDCVNQDEAGFCRVREEVRCVLDRYLLLIIDVIEGAREPIVSRGRPFSKWRVEGGSSVIGT